MTPTNTCPLCGLEYEPAGASCRSRGCPLSLGDCRLDHCPRCGYTQPAVDRGLAGWIRRRLRPVSRHGAQFAGRLSDLPTHETAFIEAMRCEPELATRLTVLGLTRDTPISVLQRFPTFVVSCLGTELALERAVAESIWVRSAGTPIALTEVRR
jgi:Fe2+ transport system protein FeoA